MFKIIPAEKSEQINPTLSVTTVNTQHSYDSKIRHTHTHKDKYSFFVINFTTKLGGKLQLDSQDTVYQGLK